MTAILYALSVFLTNYEPTRGNLGLLFGWPEKVFGRIEGDRLGTIGGAMLHTVSQSLILLFWYVVAALVLRERWPAERETSR